MSRNLAARIVLSVRDGATAPLRAVRRQFTGLRGVVTSLGTAFATYFSVRSVGRFFSSTVREASLLESALARVGAVTQASAEDMARLEAAALQMGGSTRYSSAEAAEAMESLARAGLSTTETIQALPSVLALAEGNSIGLAEAAQLTTQAANGMGIEFEESARIADVLTAAAANADTTVTQLGEALSYAAPTARALGLDIEETTALIGKLSDAGIQGSRAGTALNTAFTQFIDSGSNYRKELAAIGITTDDFIQSIVELERAGPQGEAALLALGQTAGPGMRALLAQGGDALVELRDRITDSMGDAEAAAARMDATMEGAMENLRSGWRRVKIFLGEPLLGRIAEEARSLATRLQQLVNDGSLDRLREQIVETFDRGVQGIKDFIASFGSAEEIVESFTDKFTTATRGMQRFAAGASAAGNAIIAIFQAVNTVVSTVALMIVSVVHRISQAVTGLIRGLNAIGLASDELRFKAENVTQTLDEMADALGERVVESARASGEAAVQAGESLQRMGDLNREAADSARDAADAMDEEGQAAKDMADAVDAANRKAAGSYGQVGDAADEAGKKSAGAFKGADAQAEEHRANIQALRTEYREALEAGASMQELGGILRAITAEQRALRAATTDLGDAFEELGVTSQAELDETARKGQEAFQRIRDSGTATTQELQRAFAEYAQRAADANNGVIEATVAAEGAQLGLRTEVDETGRVVVRSANEAAQATGRIAEEAGRAAGEWKRIGDEAEQAEGKIRRAAEAGEEGGSGGRGGGRGRRGRGGVDIERWQDRESLEEMMQRERNAMRNARGRRYAATRDANARNIRRMERRLAELDAEEEQRQVDRLRREKEIADLRDQERGKGKTLLERRREERPAEPRERGASRTVRIQLGSAGLDVPEAQAEAFLRELERHGARAQQGSA